MKTQLIAKKVWKYSSKLLLTVGCLLALAFGWQSTLITNSSTANAATLNSHYQILADLGTSGAKNQVEGRIQQETGKAQSAMDETGKKVDRSVEKASQKAENIKDNVSKNVREAKNKLEKTSERKGYYQR
jgi:uncharacterized protein YjbJ (UPF0337 family)